MLNKNDKIECIQEKQNLCEKVEQYLRKTRPYTLNVGVSCWKQYI